MLIKMYQLVASGDGMLTSADMLCFCALTDVGEIQIRHCAQQIVLQNKVSFFGTLTEVSTIPVHWKGVQVFPILMYMTSRQLVDYCV